MSHLTLAAAPQNFEGLVEIVFLVVMGFLWLVNRISAAVESSRRPPPRRAMPPAVPPGDAPDAVPQQGQGQAASPRPRPPVPQTQGRPGSESLQNEIEEFLRRAANRGNPQQSGQSQRPRMPPPRPAVTVAKGDSRRARGTNVVVRAKPPAPSTSDQAQTPEAIAAHVKEFLDTGEFAERRAKLSTIDEKEKTFDEKVQQTFAHEVGHLKRSALSVGGASAVAGPAQSSAAFDANSLADMFRTNADLKRAVLLNEIFQRPEQRWE